MKTLNCPVRDGIICATAACDWYLNCKIKNDSLLNPKKDWVLMCSNKYFKLTGESPEQSFWSFVDAIGLDENIESFEYLYNELDNYFPKGDKDA